MKQNVFQTIVSVVLLSTLMISSISCESKEEKMRRQREKEREEAFEQAEELRWEKLNAVALQIDSVLQQQDDTCKVFIKAVRTTALRKALDEERQAWSALIIPWTTYDHRFNYYQRDAFYRHNPDGWLFFVANLIDKRDSTLMLMKSILVDQVPSTQVEDLRHLPVFDNEQIHEELGNQILCQMQVSDSVEVTENFEKAWLRFTAAREQVTRQIPKAMQESYILDTRRWFNLAMHHLYSDLSFREMEIEEIWHRPIQVQDIEPLDPNTHL